MCTPSTSTWWDLDRSGDPAVLEPLDEVDLPQRPVPVERPGHDPGDQLAQLVGATGARQGGAAYVVGRSKSVVVDPDRVGQPPGHLLRSAGGSAARTRSGRRSARRGGRSRSPSRRARRSRRRVVARRGGRLGGQERQVARTGAARSSAAASSGAGGSGLVSGSHGILPDVLRLHRVRRPSGRWPPRLTVALLTLCRLRRRQPAETARHRRVDPDQGHRGHLRGRHRDTQRRAGRRRRPASRSSSRSRPTRPARSTCTPTRSRPCRYDEGTSTVEIEPIDQPGVVDVESHDLDKVIVQLEVQLTRSWSSRRFPRTGSAAPRTCRSPRAGHRGRGGRAGGLLHACWRSPGARPRYDGRTRPRARPTGPALALGPDRPRPAGRHPACCGCSASCSFVYRLRGGLRQGPADQPGLRHLLRVVVGRPAGRVAALRAGVAGGQPGAHDPRRRGAA